jgi:hypothetical protein
MNRILSSWVGLASHCIGECFDLGRPYIDESNESLEPLVRFVAAQLYIDCHLSSESTLLLVREGKEWDADLIARSVMEGSFKFTYMLDGTENEVRAKADEYWNVLPRFSAIRHSDRAKQLLEAVQSPEDIEWAPFRDLLLKDSEIATTRAEFSREYRRALEERWSFSGLCKEFAKSKNRARRQLVHLAHGYGMSSHLLHKDADGVGIVWERFRRDPERREVATLAHCARVVSDVCAFSELRLFCLLSTRGDSINGLRDVRKRYEEPLFSELRKAANQFNAIEYG